ncbi:unnamed protein product, partial [Vitis vinifera]
MKKKTHLLHFVLLHSLLFLGCLALCSAEQISISSHGHLTDAEVMYIKRRQLLYYRDEFGDRGEDVTVDPSLVFENPRQRNAYIALQAWKQAILSDPLNLTLNWVGSNELATIGSPGRTVPKELFDKDLDAIFINHNRFAFDLPDNFGNSPVSVIVVANNKLHGCVPASLGNMADTLNEIILMNNQDWWNGGA